MDQLTEPAGLVALGGTDPAFANVAIVLGGSALILGWVLGPIFLFGRRVRKLTVASQDRFANARPVEKDAVDDPRRDEHDGEGRRGA